MLRVEPSIMVGIGCVSWYAHDAFSHGTCFRLCFLTHIAQGRIMSHCFVSVLDTFTVHSGVFIRGLILRTSITYQSQHAQQREQRQPRHQQQREHQMIHAAAEGAPNDSYTSTSQPNSAQDSWRVLQQGVLYCWDSLASARPPHPAASTKSSRGNCFWSYFGFCSC